eukprot:GILJ01004978.1.p1 GENE.GILJ01004978.1~~GILJ01004978.1.p1  ORF type:complete len:398 (-),score=46.65 GILJ01004978.1:171-1364(-)
MKTVVLLLLVFVAVCHQCVFGVQLTKTHRRVQILANSKTSCKHKVGERIHCSHSVLKTPSWLPSKSEQEHALVSDVKDATALPELHITTGRPPHVVLTSEEIVDVEAKLGDTVRIASILKRRASVVVRVIVKSGSSCSEIDTSEITISSGKTITIQCVKDLPVRYAIYAIGGVGMIALGPVQQDVEERAARASGSSGICMRHNDAGIVHMMTSFHGQMGKGTDIVATVADRQGEEVKMVQDIVGAIVVDTTFPAGDITLVQLKEGINCICTSGRVPLSGPVSRVDDLDSLAKLENYLAGHKTLHFHGAVSGLQELQYLEIGSVGNARGDVEYENHIIATGTADRGDSGAPVYIHYNNHHYYIGAIAGGSPAEKEVYITPIFTTIAQLGGQFTLCPSP